MHLCIMVVKMLPLTSLVLPLILSNHSEIILKCSMSGSEAVKRVCRHALHSEHDTQSLHLLLKTLVVSHPLMTQPDSITHVFLSKHRYL